MAEKLHFISCRFWHLTKCYLFVSSRWLSDFFLAATLMPESCLVISLVTPNPEICQVVGKKAAKEKVSYIVRYGYKENFSQGVREDRVILSPSTT